MLFTYDVRERETQDDKIQQRRRTNAENDPLEVNQSKH